MKYLIVLFCSLYTLLAQIPQDGIQIHQNLKTLKISLSSKAKISQLSPTSFMIDEPLKGNGLSHTLQSPFESLTIHPQGEQTLITLNTPYTSIASASVQKDNQLSITFELQDPINLEWWRYLSVIGVLVLLIGYLLYLKKKIKKASTALPSSHAYKKINLDSHSQLIYLSDDKADYVVFSNQNGCVLLNRYPKTKDNTGFSKLLDEE